VTTPEGGEGGYTASDMRISPSVGPSAYGNPMNVFADVEEAAAALEILIDMAHAGASIHLLRDEKHVADLVPLGTPPLPVSEDRVDSILAELRTIGKQAKPGPESVSDVIAEGRRY